MWTWTNFRHNHFHPLKKIVYINVDESSCKMWTKPYRGLLTAHTQQKRKDGQEHRQRVTLAQRRQAFSFLALLADDAMFQNILPQCLHREYAHSLRCRCNLVGAHTKRTERLCLSADKCLVESKGIGSHYSTHRSGACAMATHSCFHLLSGCMSNTLD